MLGTWHCFVKTPAFNGKYIFTVTKEVDYGLQLETEPASPGFRFANIRAEGNRLSGNATSGYTTENDITIELVFEGESFTGKLGFRLFGEIPLAGSPGRGEPYVDPLVEQARRYRKDSIPSLTEPEIAQRVEGLLSKMTLELKVGQMSQCLASDFSFGGEKAGDPAEKLVAEGRAGAILGAFDIHRTFELQKIAVDQSPLGVPLLFHADIIHGFQTIFPVPLAWSCSWDPEQIRAACEVTAREAAVSGIHVNHGPMVDIARDPRWGRVVEGAGEDPFLGSLIATAQVRGYQGESLVGEQTIAATLKHFAAYGAAEAGRDYNTVDISAGTLRNVYLPPFKAGVEAEAGLVMNAFNVYQGIPAAGNKALLDGFLRKELGFAGVVISDYGSVEEIVTHGCAADVKEAAKMALEATLDLEMVSQAYLKNLPLLVQEGIVPESLVNEAVRRILTLKFKLGIMDDPFRYIRPEMEASTHFCADHLAESLELAQESIVLLKNDGVLPLKPDTGPIALIGPFAESKDLLGPWQFSRYADRTVTYADAIREKLAEGCELLVAKGCEVEAVLVGGIDEALRVARTAQVVILALGESSGMSGEAASRMDISLPEPQMELAQTVARLGKPVILLLTNGRPLVLKWFGGHTNDILEAWFLGSMAGRAAAQVLFGEVNPSGRLTMSFPAAVGQIPIYYNHFNTGRPKRTGDFFTSQYLDGPNEPLYPFGYGLSYIQFTYSDVLLDRATLQSGGSLTASVTIQNTGQVAGIETVQLYIRDVVGSVVRPVRELKGFRRIYLEPGERRRVEFILAEKDLSFYGLDGLFRSEAGEFVVYIGHDSTTENRASFRLNEGNAQS